MSREKKLNSSVKYLTEIKINLTVLILRVVMFRAIMTFVMKCSLGSDEPKEVSLVVNVVSVRPAAKSIFKVTVRKG